MTLTELRSAVLAAVRDAVADGEFAPLTPEIEPALRPSKGGYVTPVAMRLAATARRTAPQVAAVLVKRLARLPGVTTAEITGAGFITLTVGPPGLLAVEIVAAGESYGRVAVPVPPHPVWPDRPRAFGNPGFEVRLAYVRAAMILRHADDLDIERGPIRAELLEDPRERALLDLLAEFPARAAQTARQSDARPLARNLERVADAYHDVHEYCPALPKGDEPVTARHSARRTLAAAARVAVGNGLRMLGETPRERL